MPADLGDGIERSERVFELLARMGSGLGVEVEAEVVIARHIVHARRRRRQRKDGAKASHIASMPGASERAAAADGLEAIRCEHAGIEHVAEENDRLRSMSPQDGPPALAQVIVDHSLTERAEEPGNSDQAASTAPHQLRPG